MTVDNIGKFLLTEPEHIRVTRSFVMGILKQPCLKMNMKYSNCAGKTTSIGSILRFLHISSYGISKLATEWVIGFKSHQFDWLNLKLNINVFEVKSTTTVKIVKYKCNQLHHHGHGFSKKCKIKFSSHFVLFRPEFL